MKRDDPTPTYRGYRRQALYVLYRLFDNALGDDATVQPEGEEDLAIRDKLGRLVEVVQVKDLTANLAASSFGQFFYERVAAHCVPASQVIVRVASFGPIGPDLLAATSGDAAAKVRVIETITKDREGERKRADGTREKFKKPGLPIDQATRLVEQLQLQSVNEAELIDVILASLSQSIVGVSPQDAFDFLMWWMLTSAESKRTLQRRDAVRKLMHIGKFLEGRSAFHAEWFRSIVPLSDDPAVTAHELASKLKDEFYRGGRVRFDHILADVDIPRSVPLAKIHQGFVTSDVVVIHSASGQGKTTLAFRYLKEFAPASFRLQLLAAEGLKHARQMALAIRQHTEALGVPTVVYVDVRPGDAHWVELVRELTSQRLVRVLVTIREEDWQRSNVSGADFAYSDVSLDFDEAEGRSIYESLREQELATAHLDFEEAWTQFGPRKRLLEFVYFVTQAETLTQRIEAQVQAFQDEVRTGRADPNEESLLRLVAIASTYEAPLDLSRTIEQCGIASPIATLRRFSDEYFIRESSNGRLLEGYHAIRSEVLSDCLTDAALFPWGAIAAQAIPLMDEGDLEAFLLCAFSRRPEAVPELWSALSSFAPRTWSGVCGVMRSLMWLGLREYWEANRSVVDEAFSENPGGWTLMFDWDVARVLGDKSLNIFEGLGAAGEVAAARSRQLRQKQTNTADIFARVSVWMRSLRGLQSPPADQRDWLAAAEVMFWCGHLNVESALVSKINEDDISPAIASLPLYQVGNFMRGLREATPSVVQSWLVAHRDEFIERLRREAAIANLDETDDAVVAHYLIDLDSEASRLRRSDQTEQATKASLHDLTIERVELLSQLFAGKQKYGAVGYGHRLSIFATPYDEADKPGVLAENLHPHWTTRFNGLSRGHSEYRFRPADWREFFARLTGLREQILACLADLRSAVAKARQISSQRVMIQRCAEWDECRKAFGAGILFPKNAVDEWGFVCESGTANTHAPAQSTRQATVIRFDEFRKAISEFTRTVLNFLNQAVGALILAPALRKATSAARRQQVLGLALEQLGASENSIRLSVINGCDAVVAVRQLHSAFEQTESLHEWRDHDLESRECHAFLQAMDDWSAFVFPPEHRHRKLAFSRHEPFAWVLRPLQGRLENRLQRLRRQRIEAVILPNVIVWSGKSGLWIKANSDHPVTAVSSLELIWDAIRRAFDSDTQNPAQYCATNLVWDEIVVVLTVNHRSLDQQAYRHFKFAAFGEERSFGEVTWATVPEPVPFDAWEQTGIECSEPVAAMTSMNRLAASYVVLLQHVQHMADFVRIPDTDELGMSILQEYLNRESKRAEPMLQATYDSFAEVLNISSSLGDLDDSPNLVGGIQALLALKDSVAPKPDELDEAEQPKTHRLTIDEVVQWRDRLTNGMEMVGLARLFWMAHISGCERFLPSS